MQTSCRYVGIRLGRRVGELDDGHLLRGLVRHPVPALGLRVLGRKTTHRSANVVATGVDLAGLAVLCMDDIRLLVETAPVADSNRIPLDRSESAL